MSTRWILVRSKPGREAWAEENIARQGNECYYPQYLRSQWINQDNKRLRALTATPLFPTYLFVRIEGVWRHLLHTYGVSSVVLHGEDAATVQPNIIEFLKARESDGYVNLPPPPLKLRKNQTVQVTRGSLTGMAGQFLSPYSKNRVRVLLEVMGSKRAVILPADSVRAAA